MVYNGLVKSRQMTEEAWSGIDVQLKRRARPHSQPDRDREGLCRAREVDLRGSGSNCATAPQAVPAGDVAGRAAAEGLLGQALGKIVALAEAYPELQANENFMELHRSLDTIEGEIQMSRRYYNGAARDLNVKVDSFPSNLVANQFGFSKAGYFEIANDADRAVPHGEILSAVDFRPLRDTA